MNAQIQTLRIATAVVGFAVSSLMVIGNASAQWTFDSNQCSPDTQHQVVTLPPPSAMIMVDRSGSMGGSKWSAAKSAIDSVTTDMTQPDPDEIEFGLGLFHGSSASIKHEAAPNANSQIMSTLNSTGPGGGTPMETAIRTMLQSATVQGTITASGGPISLGRYANGNNVDIPDNCSWKTSTINVPASGSFDELRLDLTLYQIDTWRLCFGWFGCFTITWPANSADRLGIELRHDGHTETISTASQGGQSTFNDRLIGGFENADMQGNWTLAVRNCGSGGNAELEGWALEFRNHPPSVLPGRATAGILVTDGIPSFSRSGPVAAACDHRDQAPLYVVGLGSGTDKEYNDVLAAAGGTGSCSNGDPCDNPNNWSAYDGKCNGSFQTSNANDLNAALAQIANEISCTFPLEILGGGSVPESTQGCPNYDCVKVVLDGGIGRLRHQDSPTSSIGPKGWRWASDSDRKTVKLNSTYCSQVQQDNVSLVETQVACLCQQQINTACNVYNPRQCECETGKWACYYGTDVCEPNSPGSCPGGLLGEGDFCEEGLGVCRDEGQTVCDSSGNLSCNATPTSPEETPEMSCDGLDNDCDGSVDEGLDSGDFCHVDYVNNPGNAEQNAIDTETTRCNVGLRGCSGGAWTCDPLDPMPEVCNGIDDDCDNAGRIDNLNNSWNRFPSYSLSGENAPAACYERNVCSCVNGKDSIDGTNFSSYIDGWANGTSPPSPTCQCGQGIIE